MARRLLGVWGGASDEAAMAVLVVVVATAVGKKCRESPDRGSLPLVPDMIGQMESHVTASLTPSILLLLQILTPLSTHPEESSSVIKKIPLHRWAFLALFHRGWISELIWAGKAQQLIHVTECLALAAR
jgi:hypothetical protein